MEDDRFSPTDEHRFPTSRRRFLQVSSLMAVAAASHAAVPPALLGQERRGSREVRANALPGRIVLFHDAGMNGQATIDLARVEAAVHHGVRLLAGIDDTGAAFESLLPGVTSSSNIAIKVNCIGPCDTRWEVVRGIVAGLAQMLGGTYDVGCVRIYDNRYIGGHGYTNANFMFGAVHPIIATSTSCNTNYYPVSGHELSDYPYTCDYLINVPVLKSHTEPHDMTLALKNHYGSCCPADICGSGGPPTMLMLNADPYIRNKTALIVGDILRATYNGGPGDNPQVWQTFPEGTPNMLFFSTDPITADYWGRDLINDERIAHGWSAKDAPWIEQGASAYGLGVAVPASMQIVHYDPAAVPDVMQPDPLGLYLGPNVPNPFRDRTELRLRLGVPVTASLTIVDPSGRLVRTLAERDFSAGYAQVSWDGRDGEGRVMAPGMYLARLEAQGVRVARQILKIQ